MPFCQGAAWFVHTDNHELGALIAQREQAEVYAWSGGAWVLVGVVDNDVGGATPPNRPDGVDLAYGGVASATMFKVVRPRSFAFAARLLR